MLRFLGIGSAFNTTLGNNTAYIKKGDALLLIDCGGLTFQQIQNRNLLEGVQQVDIIVTHTHPDHVGSLGDLIFYCYYILGIQPQIHFPERTLLKSILDGFGVDPSIYRFKEGSSFEITEGPFSHTSVRFKPTEHVDNLPAYGFFLCDPLECLYYSGDSYQLDEEIVQALMSGQIQKLYHDTSGLDHENNRHYSFHKLKARIPEELRSKVYCMHFDKHADFEEIRRSGFQVVEIDPA